MRCPVHSPIQHREYRHLAATGNKENFTNHHFHYKNYSFKYKSWCKAQTLRNLYLISVSLSVSKLELQNWTGFFLHLIHNFKKAQGSGEINPTNSVVIPQSLIPRSIVLG